MTIAKLIAAQPANTTMTLNGCIVRINNTRYRYHIETKTGRKLTSTNNVERVIKVTER